MVLYCRLSTSKNGGHIVCVSGFKKLEGELANIVQIFPKRFPNVKMVYLSSRTYGGFATSPLNPEPYAYESGFGTRWIVQSQIKGDAQLNFDPISLVATTAQTFSASVFPPACGPFNVDAANSLIAAVILNAGPDRLNLYDLFDPSNPPALLVSWTVPGSTDNPFGLGAVALRIGNLRLTHVRLESSCGDRHQLRYCREIPVGVGHVRMANVRR